MTTLQVMHRKWLWMVHKLAHDIFHPHSCIHPIKGVNILCSVLAGSAGPEESFGEKFPGQISIHSVVAEPAADLTVAQSAPAPSVQHSCLLASARSALWGGFPTEGERRCGAIRMSPVCDLAVALLHCCMFRLHGLLVPCSPLFATTRPLNIAELKMARFTLWQILCLGYGSIPKTQIKP